MESSKELELKLFKLIKSLSKDQVFYNNKTADNNDLQTWIENNANLIQMNQDLFPKTEFEYNGKLYVSKAASVKSVLRGDIVIDKGDSIIILDSKDYINRCFKPSSFVKGDFTKTMDTPLKSLISSDFFKNIFRVNNISELLSTSLNHNITKKELVQLIKYIENGYVSFTKPTQKYFISFNGFFKVWSINYDLLPENITVKSLVYKDYIYICFFNQSELIYEVSARGDFSSNCAHLNTRYIDSQEMHEVELNSYISELIDNTHCSKNHKIIMPKKYIDEVIQELSSRRMTTSQIVDFVIKKYNLNNNKQIKERIRKDLNPSFKNKCKVKGIDFYDGVYFKSTSITSGK